jgi:UDP-glucose 4-epimerase
MTAAGTTWITGAHGFIGQRLAELCARRGQTVGGLGHGAWPPSEARQQGIRLWINGDITASNLNALRVAQGKPDAIVHLAGGSSVGAAIAHPYEDFLRTVGATAVVLEWIRQESAATRLVVASSAAVYGAGYGDLIGEEAERNPVSPYGHHKLMMESLCRSYGANYGVSSIIARLFSVYGTGLRKQLLWDLCCKLAQSTPLIELAGDGGELRDWVDVDDAVAVLATLATHADASAPAVNVGTGTGVTVRRVATLVLDAWDPGAGGKSELKFSGLARVGDPRCLVANTSRLAELGLKCASSIERGAAQYVRWYRSAGGIRSHDARQ